MAALTARDRTVSLAILENAQWVYALSRYPKKQVLHDPVDLKMLRDRVGAMRQASRGLSAAQKKKLDVPWDTVDEEADERPDALWAMAKKVIPKIMAELRPLVSDTPEAAFLISPEPKKTGGGKTKTTAKNKTASTRKRKT
jgi:hypothetical protein